MKSDLDIAQAAKLEKITTIAKKLDMHISTAVVRVSQIKRDGINCLIENTDRSQVLEYL